MLGAHMSPLPRQSEPELMDLHDEAQAYAKADFHEVNEAFVDRLLQVAGPAGSLRALDLGAGPADIPIRVLRRRPQWTIVALDGSSAMLSLARQAVDKAGLGDRLALVLGDAKATPLEAGAFEVIFSNSILHHINDPAALWREVRRLAKPGTVVFFRDLFRPASQRVAEHLVAQYALHESKLLRQEFLRSLLAAYTPGEARRQLADAGLTGLKVETVTDRHMDIYGRL